MLLLLMTGGSALPLYASPSKGWEAVKTERQDAKVVGHNGDVEVKTARGVVMVTTNRAIQVKIYTILGQMVSSDTVGPGSFQFTIPTHGIYIVKIGENLTFKVAL